MENKAAGDEYDHFHHLHKSRAIVDNDHPNRCGPGYLMIKQTAEVCYTLFVYMCSIPYLFASFPHPLRLFLFVLFLFW
jgi:hypothetical protein